MNSKRIKLIVKKIIGKSYYEKLLFLKKTIVFSKLSKTDCFCPCCRKNISEWNSFKQHHWEEKFNKNRFPDGLDKCICPICDSVPRQRIEATYLCGLEMRSKRILIWAPENSIIMYLKSKKIKYITADLCDDTVDVVTNIEKSVFNDAEFDLVLCNHVLEHVDDVREALIDTYRILRKNGIAIITVPKDEKLEFTKEEVGTYSDEQRKTLFGQADHKRIFGRDFINYLQDTGFKVTELVGYILCDNEVRPIVGPASYDSNILYVCKKE